MLTLDQSIALVSGGAALATAIATFLTIREIAKQRKSAYKPDIVPANQYAYACAQSGPKVPKFGWSKERPTHDESRKTTSFLDSRCSVTLFNVGLGSAANIKAEWQLNLSPWVSTINTLAQRTFTSLIVEEDKQASTVKISGPDYVPTVHLVGNQLTDKWGHLLPASLDRTGIELPVPSIYLELVALQVALGLMLQTDGIAYSDWAKLPTTNVILSHRDLNGDIHKRSMILRFELLAAGHESQAYKNGQYPSFLHFMVRLEAA